MEDNEYPDWLWRMLDPKPTLSELERKLEPVISREINGIGELRELMENHEEDIRRYAKLLGTRSIKESNRNKEK